MGEHVPPGHLIPIPSTGEAVQLAKGQHMMMSAGRRDIFPLLKLPAEIRERIYGYFIQSALAINTSAIPGTPDRVVIPNLAQVSKQVRHEVLYLLFKCRPIEISLHSPENLRRALVWVNEWRAHAQEFTHIEFSGRFAAASNNFFGITLKMSKVPPVLRFRSRPCASAQAKQLTQTLVASINAWLKYKVQQVEKGGEASLTAAQLSRLINEVEKFSRRE